jgi:putative transferase (TIGR04331 family)
LSYNLVFTKLTDLSIRENSFLFIDHVCLNNIVDNYFDQNFKIAKSYGYEKKEMESDFVEVKKYCKTLIEELGKILNEYHDIKFSNKQWQILISLWTHRTISLLLNRFKKIEKTFKENKISSITLYKNNLIDLVNHKTADISHNSNNQYLNNIIFDEIIKFKNIDVKKNYINKKKNEHSNVDKTNLLNKFKIQIKELINILNRNKIKESKSLIIDSCLPKKENKKLLKYYNQPKIYINSNFKSDKELNMDLRKKLENKINLSTHDEFYRFVISIIFKIFPSCYLENFQNLVNKCNESILPKKPKFIFTSNAMDTNEIFKIYLCKNFPNTKYYGGQHGGATPIYKFGVLDTYLFDQVDGFFNWGWQNTKNNFQSFMLPKLTKLKKLKKNDKIAVMLRPMMHATSTWDKSEEALILFKKNIEFIHKCKNLSFYDKIFIKAYPNVKCKINNFRNWKKYSSIKNFDYRQLSFDKYKDDCDLNIFTYESTGFFQLININKPTIILFSSFNKDIKDQYKSDFDKLAKVGIIHYEHESLLKHLSKIDNKINSWWFSNLVQEKINIFKNKFASDSKDFKFLIKKIKY